MGKGARLRRVADPVVAAPPAGVRIRTRIHVSEAEAAALTAIGAFLGSVYRGELAERIDRGVLDRRGHRGGPGHQPLGQSALDHTVAATDFRPGHRDSPSRCGGRDRQTWPRTGDQATAGRTPHRTAECGHTTVQARPSPRLRWQARQFRPTDTPTMRYLGSPENTRRQRPTPFGPHRTHSCALTRNGRECCRGKLVSAPSNLPFGSWQQRQDDREGEEPARR